MQILMGFWRQRWFVLAVLALLVNGYGVSQLRRPRVVDAGVAVLLVLDDLADGVHGGRVAAAGGDAEVGRWLATTTHAQMVPRKAGIEI